MPEVVVEPKVIARGAFGPAFKLWRKRRFGNQLNAAIALRVAISTIRRWENEGMIPWPDHMRRIRRAGFRVQLL